MTTSNKYRELLRRQIESAGEYLIKHADDLVPRIPAETNISIRIQVSTTQTMPAVSLDSVYLVCDRFDYYSKEETE